jgi:hypothetical protein
MAAFRIPRPDEVKPTNSPSSPTCSRRRPSRSGATGSESLASSPDRRGQPDLSRSTAPVNCAVSDGRRFTGRVLWKKKVGIEQRQSTPFYADGLPLRRDVRHDEGRGQCGIGLGCGQRGSNGDLDRPPANRRRGGGGQPDPVGGAVLWIAGRDMRGRVLCADRQAAVRVRARWPRAPDPGRTWPHGRRQGLRRSSCRSIPYEFLLRPGQTQSNSASARSTRTASRSKKASTPSR